jgi:hypothetical protein
MIEIDWQNKAEKLWQLLNDIDTASDMFKPHDEKSYKAFFDYTMKKCQERGKYMNSLDGQTLTSVEQEIYNYQLKERTRLLQEWENKVAQQVKAIIVNKTNSMSEKEKDEYFFKWKHLVQQEIAMWIRLNNPVSQEEIETMCKIRRFDAPMKSYLESAMEIVCLYEKDYLPPPKTEIPEGPEGSA